MGLNKTKRKAKLAIKDSRGLSPAISTILMTAAIVVLVLVAMAYGNNYLTSSIAQNEFKTNEQFMVTTGLQIDNVAWMIGRAQTIQYSSTYGDLQVLPNASKTSPLADVDLLDKPRVFRQRLWHTTCSTHNLDKPRSVFSD
jgi:hypothetical protein